MSSLCGGVQNTSLGWNYKFLRRVAVSERQHSFGLKKRQMFVMLSITLKKSIILFDNKYYSHKMTVWLWAPHSFQPYWIFFSVTTKVFGLKMPQEIQTEISQNICGWYYCTFWKTWAFATICCIYKQTIFQYQIFSRSWKKRCSPFSRY